MLIYTSVINLSFIDSSHKLPSHGERPEQSEAAPSAGGCESFHVWVQSFLEHIVNFQCDARFTPDVPRMAAIGTRHEGIVLHMVYFEHPPWVIVKVKNKGIWAVFKIKHHYQHCNYIWVFIYQQYPNGARERSTHTCTTMNERLQWETKRLIIEINKNED